MRGKKALLIVTLTLLLGAMVTSIIPVKADNSVTLVFRYDGTDGQGDPIFVAPRRVGDKVSIYIDIYAPTEWDNTDDGIIGYGFTICSTRPNVLEAHSAIGATAGYYLWEFCDYYDYTENYPSLLVGSIDDACVYQIGEVIMGWEDLGVGAGGSSDPDTGWYGYQNGLVHPRFTALSLTDCSNITISDAMYFRWCYGKTPQYFDSIETPGFYVENPCIIIPEFPSGAEVAVGIGLMAAVVYIWLRKRKTNPIVAKRFTTQTPSQ